MLETYQGILHDNRIEWIADGPKQISPDRKVPVHVTLLEPSIASPAESIRGPRMAAALEPLAASQALKDIVDPVAWERETRQDCPLPGRDE